MKLDEEKNKAKILGWIMKLRAVLREPDDAKAEAAGKALIDEIAAEDDE